MAVACADVPYIRLIVLFSQFPSEQFYELTDEWTNFLCVSLVTKFTRINCP